MLFRKPGLREALAARSGELVAGAVMDALLVHPKASRLQLRRAALVAALVEPLVLSDPAPAAVSAARAGALSPLEMRCAVPFSGAAWLFDWSAPVWPAPHEVRGEVDPAHLLLLADGSPGDETWLPAVLGGEVQEVDRIATAQAILVGNHNRNLSAQIRVAVDYVHPRITQASLRRLGEISDLVDEATPYAVLSRNIVREVRMDIWRAWTS